MLETLGVSRSALHCTWSSHTSISGKNGTHKCQTGVCGWRHVSILQLVRLLSCPILPLFRNGSVEMDRHEIVSILDLPMRQPTVPKSGCHRPANHAAYDTQRDSSMPRVSIGKDSVGRSFLPERTFERSSNPCVVQQPNPADFGRPRALRVAAGRDESCPAGRTCKNAAFS